MSRLKELEARRQLLLRRCDEQRDELTERLAQLTPGTLLRNAAGVGASGKPRHPLAWVAALGAVLLVGRAREILTWVLWVRSAIAVAGRAAQLVRLLGQTRTPRADH